MENPDVCMLEDIYSFDQLCEVEILLLFIFLNQEE